MTSSNGNIFRVTGHLCGEFTVPALRPVTRSFDVFFDLRPNTRLSKQWWGWWFETLSSSLWRQCNVIIVLDPSFQESLQDQEIVNVFKHIVGQFKYVSDQLDLDILNCLNKFKRNVSVYIVSSYEIIYIIYTCVMECSNSFVNHFYS